MSAAGVALLLAIATPPRAELDLGAPADAAEWQVTSDDPFGAAPEWFSAAVPGVAEDVFGAAFDGVTAWRRSFALPSDFRGDRLLLHFDAVATVAHVWLNDELVATHEGPWTPFRADVTRVARRGAQNRLLIVVEERAGHDTQGFLPAIAPHFGGIWQGVRLIGLAHAALDDLQLLAHGDPETGQLTIEAPLTLGEPAAPGPPGPPASRESPAGLRARATVWIGDRAFDAELAADPAAPPVFRGVVQTAGALPWDIDAPHLYRVRVALLDRDGPGAELDSAETRAAFRSVEARGRTLLLNGRPLLVRGILDWGYDPPRLAPVPDDLTVRRRIADAKARGFNLIKFCLWVPPARVLELCDELGMLAWQEYPLWHARITDDRRDALLREFDAFHAHDRTHPSVILRSLTCEAGPSASLAVLTALYERAHERIPDALVVDDSSWLAWNRVHDFWDDHPYGNCDDWLDRIRALQRHVAEHGAQPLLLGEAIAADTWLDRSLLTADAARDAWWLPIHFDAQTAWERRMRDRFGPRALDALEPWSLRFALEMRKCQIETLRAAAPEAGYVVAAARDFRQAQMGLCDHAGRWKWDEAAWNWHRDTMVMLEPGTPRALRGGTTTYAKLRVVHHGASFLPGGTLEWSFAGQQGSVAVGAIAPGAAVDAGPLVLRAPEVPAPRGHELAVRYVAGGASAAAGGAAAAENRWTLWVVPLAGPRPPALDVVTTHRLTRDLWRKLRDGARVVLFADASPGSFRAEETWLLRGAPWFPPHPATDAVPTDMLLDLALHDLHPKGLVPLDALFDEVDPIVAFWETHDRPEVRDRGIVFETSVERGRLVVCTLDARPGAAGDWLRAWLERHAMHGPAPAAALEPATVAAIDDVLAAKRMDLTARPWQFRPFGAAASGADGAGGAGGADEQGWTTVKIGEPWESQGFPALDGWAAYRIEIDVPGDWAGEPLYLVIDGADDAYEARFDGVPCGSGGDPERRASAFDERRSHVIAEHAEPGRHVLEIDVLDWQGAGGLHLPICLATRAPGAAEAFLVPP